MSKYEPLADFLRADPRSTITLTFQQVDRLVDTLPPSARDHRPWWANSRTNDSHTWAHLWIDAGWECSSVDLERELVTFERHSPYQRPPQSFWWVNHKQTHRVELEGGYIWSPKKKKNGARNQAYVNLTRVRPGDVVVSYADTLIKAIGVATSRYREAAKPGDYGSAGDGWEKIGWKVPIEWTVLEMALRPKDFLGDIRPLLPRKYSPLQDSGDGNQSIYLANISSPLGQLILAKVGEFSLAALDQINELEVIAAEQAELELVHLATAVPKRPARWMRRSSTLRRVIATRSSSAWGQARPQKERSCSVH